MKALMFLFSLCFLSSFVSSTFNPQKSITETKSAIAASESRYFDLTIDYKDDLLKKFYGPVCDNILEPLIQQINQEIKDLHLTNPDLTGKLLEAYAKTVIDHLFASRSFSEYQTNFAAYEVFGEYIRRHFSSSLENLVTELVNEVKDINSVLSKVTRDVLERLKSFVPPDHPNSKVFYNQIFSGIFFDDIEAKTHTLWFLLGVDKTAEVIKYVKDNIKSISFANTLYVGLKELFSEFEKEQGFVTFIEFFYSYTLFSYLLNRFPDSTEAFNFIFPKLDCDLLAQSGKRLCEEMNVKDILEYLAKFYEVS